MKLFWMSLMVAMFVRGMNQNENALNHNLLNQQNDNEALNHNQQNPLVLNNNNLNQVNQQNVLQQICDTPFMNYRLVNQFIPNPCKTYGGNQNTILLSILGTSLYVVRFFLQNVHTFPWIENHETLLIGANFLDAYQVFLLAPICIWQLLNVHSDVPQFAIPTILAFASASLNLYDTSKMENATIVKIVLGTLIQPAVQAVSRYYNWQNYQRNIAYRAEMDEKEMNFMFKALKDIHNDPENGLNRIVEDAYSLNFAQKKVIVMENLVACFTNASDEKRIKLYIEDGEKNNLGIFQTIPSYTEDEIDDEFDAQWSKLGYLFRRKDDLSWMKTELKYKAQLRRASKMVSRDDILNLKNTFVRKSKEQVLWLILQSFLIWAFLGSGGGYPYDYFVAPGEGESFYCYKQASAFQRGKCDLYFLYYQSDRLLIYLTAACFLYSIDLNAGLNMTFMRPFKRYYSDWKRRAESWKYKEKILIGIISLVPFFILGGGVWFALFNFTSIEVYKKFGVDGVIQPGLVMFFLCFFTDFWRMLLSIYGYVRSFYRLVRIHTPRKFIDIFGGTTETY